MWNKSDMFGVYCRPNNISQKFAPSTRRCTITKKNWTEESFMQRRTSASEHRIWATATTTDDQRQKNYTETSKISTNIIHHPINIMIISIIIPQAGTKIQPMHFQQTTTLLLSFKYKLIYLKKKTYHTRNYCNIVIGHLLRYYIWNDIESRMRTRSQTHITGRQQSQSNKLFTHGNKQRSVEYPWEQQFNKNKYTTTKVIFTTIYYTAATSEHYCREDTERITKETMYGFRIT